MAIETLNEQNEKLKNVIQSGESKVAKIKAKIELRETKLLASKKDHSVVGEARSEIINDSDSECAFDGVSESSDAKVYTQKPKDELHSPCLFNASTSVSIDI